LFVFGKNVQFWIEVKRKNGAKREKQKQFIEAVKKHGGQGAFVDSLDQAVAYEMQVQGVRREASVSDGGLDKPSKEGQPNRGRSRAKRKPDSKPDRETGIDTYMLSD
jgi:hypothetical protein